MPISLVPPTFDTVYERQPFVSILTFYDGVTPVNNISSITVDYQLGGVGAYLSLPSVVSSELITTGTGAGAYKEIILRGTWPQYTLASSWVTQPTSSNTSTASFANYESVVSNGTPYFSARDYNADSSAATTVAIRIRALRWTAALGNFEEIAYPTQTLSNNWNRKRNQVIPFVQGGDIDVETFRFPGGSLGGAVGQDLPEPALATGLTTFPINLVYTTGTGTFTVPASAKTITVRLFGGGGRGGRGYALSNYSASGGGGGSGGFVEFTTSVTAGQTFQWSVGAGGTESNKGVGGTTNFGGNFASGGQPGADGFLAQGVSRVAGGVAGSPNGLTGNPGSVSQTTSSGTIADQVGGDGADCIDPNIGQGGNGGDKLTPTGVVGQPGTGFAAGGGGGGTQRGTPQPWAGANGQPGRIEISYLGSRFVFVDNVTVNTQNYNVRTQALAAGWDGTSPLDVTIIIAAGVYVWSNSISTAAFIYDNLPADTIVKLTNNGYIIGKGGKGGDWYAGNPALLAFAENGGPAIILNSTLLFISNNGYIAGGGGGGGHSGLGLNNATDSGGGGGAGGGQGGGSIGDAGGNAYAGGAGGGLGASGSPSTAYQSGAGGGRVLPGTAGAGATVGITGSPTTYAQGGGAGGGGGVSFFTPDGVNIFGGANGGNGGASNAVGANGEIRTAFRGAGGGGGWGAAGGAGEYGVGGTGGKAIDTRGFDVVFSSIGTIYGAVSGTKVSDSSFSTVLFTNTQNANLRTLTLAAGWNGTATANVTVAGPTYFWSDTTATAGLIVSGSWPNGVTLNNYGKIIGRGGNSTAFTSPTASAFVPPQPGGPAMLVSIPNLRLFNNGYIAGGGGGGGGDIYSANGGAGAGGGINWASQVISPTGYFGSSPVSYRRTPTSPIITVPAPTLGLGGAIGQAGQPGGYLSEVFPTGIESPPFTSTTFFGGGGGRILPGTAGIGGNQPGHFVSTTGNPVDDRYARGLGEGGEAGGGGSGARESPGGVGGGGILIDLLGGNGGAAAGVGGPSGPAPIAGGGGGGGWGAVGGTSFSPGAPGAVNFGGVGGKSIIASGNTITFLRVGAIWGALS